MFLLRQSGQGMIVTFLEVDIGTMSLNSVLEKLRRYSRWAESSRGKSFITDLYRKHGAASPQAKFRLAIICGRFSQTDGQQRLNNVLEDTARLPTSIRNAIWLTTTMAVRDCDNLLRREIWIRGSVSGTVPNDGHAYLMSVREPNLA
jgi:hypothetical protein